MHFLKDPELTMPCVPLFTSPSPAEERHHKRSGRAGDDGVSVLTFRVRLCEKCSANIQANAAYINVHLCEKLQPIK